MSASDGLYEWERRVPHFKFLTRLFVEKDNGYRLFDSGRVSRFIRFRAILLRNWRAMEEQARQMANHPGFQKLWRDMNRMKKLLKELWGRIEKAMYRAGVFGSFGSAAASGLRSN